MENRSLLPPRRSGNAHHESGVALWRGAALWAVLISLGVAGCSFEPALHVPAAPKVKAYTAGAAAHGAVAVKGVGRAGAGQQFAYGKKMQRTWWKLLKSKQIDTLIHRAVLRSPTIAQALATLQEAHQNTKAIDGEGWPQVSLTGGGNRQRLSGAQFGGSTRSFSLYTGQVNVSYTPDLFGLNKLARHQTRALEDAQRFNLQEAYLTLEGNTVSDAILMASYDAQIRTTQTLVAIQRNILKLITQEYKLGAVTYLDVLNQRTLLETTRAKLPPLRQSLAAARHALAVLVGTIPSEANLPHIRLKALQLPMVIPVSLPSVLTRNRPDIKLAEAELRADNASIGVAIAKMYPTVQLTGDLGFENGRIPDFFNASSLIWDLAANASVTLFDGGTLIANKRAAQAVLRAQIAAYQSTVLSAFQQVADALRAVQNDAVTLQLNQSAFISAKQAFVLARRQYRAGAIDYLSLLNTQTQYQQTELGVVTAEAQRYRDTAALFVALGGGWWPKEYSHRTQAVAVAQARPAAAAKPVSKSNKANAIQ